MTRKARARLTALLTFVLVIMAAIAISSTASAATGFVKKDGKIYYYKANGKQYKIPGWKTIEDNDYYFQEDYSVATGVTKIARKNYSFSKKGVLRKNRRPFLYKKKYYVTNSKGVMSQVDDLEGEASVLTRKFIKAHTKTSDSAATKLKKCFNYLIAYSYYNTVTDKNCLLNKGAYYVVVRDFTVWGSPEGKIQGCCYDFACIFASTAKELGYTAYVIVMDKDHAVVQIGSKFYDNMGARYAADSPYLTGYKVVKKIKF